MMNYLELGHPVSVFISSLPRSLMGEAIEICQGRRRYHYYYSTIHVCCLCVVYPRQSHYLPIIFQEGYLRDMRFACLRRSFLDAKGDIEGSGALVTVSITTSFNLQ